MGLTRPRRLREKRSIGNQETSQLGSTWRLTERKGNPSSVSPHLLRAWCWKRPWHPVHHGAHFWPMHSISARRLVHHGAHFWLMHISAWRLVHHGVHFWPMHSISARRLVLVRRPWHPVHHGAHFWPMHSISSRRLVLVRRPRHPVHHGAHF